MFVDIRTLKNLCCFSSVAVGLLGQPSLIRLTKAQSIGKVNIEI
jgi:hypothetical protein